MVAFFINIFSWSTIIELSGKTINNIYLFGIFMKLVNNISKKAASGSKHAISNISSKFTFRLRKLLITIYEKECHCG
jgi:hypothetical protein